MTYDEIGPISANAAGSADQYLTHIFPTRPAYHRFGVGDPVYVHAAENKYLPRRIKGVFYLDKQVYYELDDLRLVAEKSVLSPDEYLRRLDPRTPAPRRVAKRQLSVLKRVPTELVEMILQN
jgi:hypothetical protein